MEAETSSTRERASSLLGRSGEAKITLFSADARAGVYYKLHVTCSATRRSLESTQRYSTFRGAYRVLRRSGATLPAFPPKIYARAALGVALSPAQVAARTAGLDAYFAAAFARLDELPLETRRRFCEVLFLEEVAGAAPPPAVDAAYAAEPRDRAATLWTPPSSAPSYRREAYAPGLV
jgi:hypothetical protein